MNSKSAQSSGTRLDPWIANYAERADNLRESEIRALFAVVSRPEVVSLAGGMPNLKDLPLDALADSARNLIAKHGATAMQYGSGQGWEPLREMIVEVMRYDGISGDAGNVVITTGSQQALDLVTQIFINPHDVILAESPSYVGALGVFNAYQADTRHIPMDEDGLIPQALEEMIKELRAQKRNIKFLYTIPNFQNPAGISLSLERRPQIVEICKQNNILIVEDNPYGLLGFDSDPEAALQSYNPDGVVYLGSFSKMFAPGFRVGWAYAPHAIREKLVLASESAILSPSMVGQMAICGYLEEYDWYLQVKKFRSMYQERCNAMMSALEEHLPYCSWTKPAGGFYTWVTLPEGIDAKSMMPRAITGLVAYVSGTAFYADGSGGDHLRLSFCYPPPEEIREGVRRLAKVMQKERDLVAMFGTNINKNPQRPSINSPGPNLR